MSQRTLKSAGVLSFSLLVVILLTGGLAPTVRGDTKLQSQAEQDGRSQLPQQRPSRLRMAPTGAREATPILETERGGMREVTVTSLPPTTTPTMTSLPTSTSVPATPTPAPVYVPPDDNPAPLVAADLCDETHGQVSVHSFYSENLRREIRYRIYLPPCYEQAGRLFPVLYLFHGLNYGDSQWDSLGLDELLDEGIASGEMVPLIVVMPNGWGIDREPDGGPGSFEALIVNDLLPHVERHYCAWDAREGRAVGGLSRGAFWALEIAFRHPRLFASVGGHSPAVFWDNAPPQYNPYYLADDAPELESLRIYLDVGEQDWLNKWVVRFRERLDARGLAYTFSTAPGDHGYAYWRSQIAGYIDFYTSAWPSDWRELPTPPDCLAHPDAPGCRNGLGLGRPCDIALP
jgi:enterochelin esterase-like enzyme